MTNQAIDNAIGGYEQKDLVAEQYRALGKVNIPHNLAGNMGDASTRKDEVSGHALQTSPTNTMREEFNTWYNKIMGCEDGETAFYAGWQAAILAMPEFSWQPIETAPKDGTRILVTDGEEIEVADWYVRQYPDEYIQRPDGLFEKAPPVYADGYWNCNYCQKPTHWMPLPSPPFIEE